MKIISVLSSLTLFSSFPAFGQVLSDGSFVGEIHIGAQCTKDVRTCIRFSNDGGYPMEVASVTYGSRSGQVTIESPPVMGKHLQCVFPDDGRACAPVLAPGQAGAMELPLPPASGQLIIVELRQWDPPGSEVALPKGTIILQGMEVTLIGDPVAAFQQQPATQAEVREVRLGVNSGSPTWRKGKRVN